MCSQQSKLPTRRMSEPGIETSRIDWFLSYVFSIIPMFSAGIKHLFVDAYFFKKKFVTDIRTAGLHVISKMRKDARLLSLYSGPQKSRGRRKKFSMAPIDVYQYYRARFQIEFVIRDAKQHAGVNSLPKLG